MRNRASDDCQVFAEPCCFLKTLCSEGFGGREEVECLKPIRLSLPVIAKQDIQPAVPMDPAAQISKIDRLNRFKQHSSILAWRGCLPELRRQREDSIGNNSSGSELELYSDSQFSFVDFRKFVFPASSRLHTEGDSLEQGRSSAAGGPRR
jgi:hypothetical protein